VHFPTANIERWGMGCGPSSSGVHSRYGADHVVSHSNHSIGLLLGPKEYVEPRIGRASERGYTKAGGYLAAAKLSCWPYFLIASGPAPRGRELSAPGRARPVAGERSFHGGFFAYVVARIVLAH
jgi:hypothetical protein